MPVADSLLALATPGKQAMVGSRISWVRVVGDLEEAGGSLNLPRNDADGRRERTGHVTTSPRLNSVNCAYARAPLRFRTPTWRPHHGFNALSDANGLRHPVTHGSVYMNMLITGCLLALLLAVQ